jgi:PAS domain S-box-containing protein
MTQNADDAALFHQFLENSPDNIYVVDREGRYTHVSRNGALAFGVEPEAMIGRSWLDFARPDSIELATDQWNRVLQKGEIVEHEVTFRGRLYRYFMFPIGTHAAVISRDLTERMQQAEALTRAAERYKSFVANSTEGIWRCEVEQPIDITLSADAQVTLMVQHGVLAEANDAMARMYGFEKAEEVIGARISDLLDMSRQENHDYLHAFVESGYRLSDAESIETDRHGNRKYFLNSLTGVVIDGKLLRAWGTQRDIGAQKEAVEHLRRSEERLQALVTAANQIIWTAVDDGQLTWITPTWTEITGQTLEEAKGRGWLSLIHDDDRDGAIAFWTRALAGGVPVQDVMRVRDRSGDYRWFHVRGAPLMNDDGTIREWVGAVTDVDARHREEEVLTAAAQRAKFIAAANDLFVQSLDYEQTLRNLARLAVPELADWCAVDMIDEDGTFRRLAAEHPDPAMLQLAYKLQEKFPPDPKSPRGAFAVAREGKTDWMAEIPDEFLVAGSRSEEHLELVRQLRLRSWICTPIRVRDRVVGVFTLVNGASSRRFNESDVALAEELAARAGQAVDNARHYEQAVEANRAKDEFLATLSHELRTPLTAILGWANLLKISNFDAQTTKLAVETIENSARNQAALIDDLLDISRVVTGKLQLKIATIDAVPVIENGVAASRPAAEAKRITLVVDTPPDLQVRADPNRLHQIIWNLMSNAVKFSSEGAKIEVSASRLDGDAVISVRDYGIGIDPAQLPRVFDRFWQADSSSHRLHGGLGLGLAIVKYLAELHGGTASVHSEGEGTGTTFTIRLPLLGDVQTNSSETPALVALGMRVLLVDDDEAARDVVRRTLEHYGATVVSVSNALDAIDSVSDHPFDLVLTDLAMPQHDGYWLLREVRRRKPMVRVAAITALGQSEEQILAGGFDSYLRKPLDPELLKALLRRDQA